MNRFKRALDVSVTCMLLLVGAFFCTLFCTMFCSIAYAQPACEDVFPDGVSNVQNANSITFGWDSRIFASPDNILETNNLIDNGNPGTSCNTSDCSASGNTAEDINYNSFVNNQPDVSLGYQATGTVSAGDYNNLSLASESTLTMNPGVYTFRGAVDLQYLSEIIVSGAGTVVIYVRGAITLNSQAVINNAAGDRYVFMFTRDALTMQSNSVIKGVVYTRSNVTLQSAAHLTGAITARGNITLNSASFVTYNSTAVSNTNFDSLCTSTPVSAASLVSHWQFDEYAWTGTASEIVDASGNGNHGTAVNSLSTSTLSPAINTDPGTCYYGEFDGAAHYATVPNLSSTLNGTASLAFWVNTTEVGAATPYSSPAITGVEENGGTDDIFWGWIDDSGRIGLAVGNDATTKSTSAINDGTWHHVVLTRDHTAGQFKIYVDGALESSGAIIAGTIGNTYSSIGRVEVVGTTTTPQYFAGSIDEVQVYSGVLSDAEVTTIMAQTHVCPTVMCASDAPVSGLFGEYYNSRTLSGSPVGTRTDTTIDFNWGNGSPGVSSVGTDQFSVDWNGYVRAEETGTYYFQTESDDGVRLWVDGNLIIDNWTNHSPTTNTSAGVSLVAGQAYDVTLQYYEDGGGAVIRLRWQTPSGGGYSAITGGSSPVLSAGMYSCPAPVTPEAMCTSGGIPTPGLEGSYYNSVDLTGGVTATRIDSTVDFDWDTGTTGVTGLGANQFSIEWNGYIYAAETGYYSFQTDSDDGVRLWVGGELVIENWTEHAEATNTSSGVSLVAGETYSIRMQFYENGGFAVARLRWQTPSGGSYEILPAGSSPTVGAGSYYCAPDMPDHYGISHSGTGITCEAEAITVTAYDALNNPFVPVAGTAVTLSDNIGDGTWSPSNVYTFAGSESSFTAYLRQITPATINLNVSDGSTTESASLDPDITFVESLLRFYGDRFNSVIPNQVAAVTDNNVVVRAVETDDTGACIARVANTSFTGRLAFECVNPSNCVAGQALSLDGDSVQANDSAAAIAYTTVTMDFDAQGYSSLPLDYTDVGQVRLHGQVDIPATGDDPAITLSGTSNNFVVKPYTVGFSVIRSNSGTTNPEALNGGTGFVAAGEDFTVRLAVRNASGSRTPNFGNESTPESVRIEMANLVYPTGGSNGVLSGVNSFSPTPSVAGRFISTTVSWNDVGGININARLADDDYLGAGDLVSIIDNNIGRFYPDHFELVSSNTTEACGAFSYMSQPAITVQYQVQANAVGGGAVSNYDAALGYAPLASFSHSAENADSGTNLASRLAINNSSWASGVYDLNTASAAFNRTSVLEAPLTQIQLGVTLSESDGRVFTAYDTHAGASGDCSAAGNCSAVAIGSEMEMRFGRLRVADAFGPETAPLPVSMRTEYWDGINWLTNVADSCTQIANTDVALPDGTIDVVANKTVTVGGGASAVSFPYSGLTYVGFSNGDAGASFSAPGAGNQGEIQVNVDMTNYPWLRFDWDQNGDHSDDTALPTAQFNFGSYRGHDRIIYWREVLGQ